MRVDPSAIYKKYQQVSKVGKETSVKGDKMNLKEGQVIKGEILDANQSNIKIRLSNGQVLQAKMSSDFQFSIGEEVNFIVKDATPEQILLTPDMNVGEQMTGKMTSILEGANLPNNESNQAMLKLLIENNMPIDAQSLKAMTVLQNKYPDAKMSQLVFMTKHNIPINPENLSQMTMLENNEHALMRGIASLAEDISTSATLSKNEQQVLEVISNNEGAISFLKDVSVLIDKLEGASTQQVVTDAKGNVMPQPTIDASVNTITVQPEPLVLDANSGIAKGQPITNTQGDAVSQPIVDAQVNTVEQPVLDAQGNIVPDASLRDALPPALSVEVTEILNTQSSDVPIKEVLLGGDFEKLATMIKGQTGITLNENTTLGDLQTLVEKGAISPDQLRDVLLNVKEQGTYATIAKGLLMSENDLKDVKELKSYFVKLHDKVTELIESSQSLFGKESAVAKEAGNVKASVEFMNALNQDFNMLHLPMLLGDQLLNSEIYVMNDSKAVKSDKETITALVRLDLLNLGHTDIYVKKTNKNVDVKFYMTEESQVDIMKENVHKLHNILKDKGFNVMGAEVLPLGAGFDVKKDFLENDGKKTDLKRYTFDMRA